MVFQIGFHCSFPQEAAALLEHEHEHDEPDAYMKKSPSQDSCGSVEVYVATIKNGSANPDDKERISIKSDCMDNRRRLSIINTRGKKVSIENIAASQVITIIMINSIDYPYVEVLCLN